MANKWKTQFKDINYSNRREKNYLHPDLYRIAIWWESQKNSLYILDFKIHYVSWQLPGRELLPISRTSEQGGPQVGGVYLSSLCHPYV